MSKQKIKQIAAVVLIVFLIFIFALSIYFSLMGNIAAALSALAFNAFFCIILFFLIRLNRYITDVSDDEESSDK